MSGLSFLAKPIFENPIIEITLIIFCGLAFGSFASALTYRVPRDLAWAIQGKDKSALRSACPQCKEKLTALDLIPIFSWVVSGGKCRHCKAPVSVMYPMCEVLALLACVLTYFIFGLTYASLPLLLAIPFLVALLMIDFEHMILPNQLVAIVFLLGLTNLVLKYLMSQDWQVVALYISSAVIFGLFAWGLGGTMKKMLKRDALGFGDVKFFIVAGMWIGIPFLGYFCALAGVLGVLIAAIWQKVKKQAVFPFGPALIVSFYILLLLEGSHLI